VSVADPPAATPTPTPTPSPVGELQVIKVDTSGQPITTPGFTFNVHVGSASGQVIATITTDGTGSAVAAALNPATYCVEEIAAAEGYQLAPAYSPGACVSVTADTTQGRSPTRVTVTDPPAPSPSPSSTSDAGTTTSSPAPGSGARVSSRPASTFGFSPGTLSRLLIGLGGLLLLVGVVLTVVAIRRRRSKPPAPPPPTDYWYDSTIG